MIFDIKTPGSCSDCVFGEEGGYDCNLLGGELCNTTNGRPVLCPFDCNGETIAVEGTKVVKGNNNGSR